MSRLVLAIAVLAVLPCAAHANHNDLFENRVGLTIGTPVDGDNFSTSTTPGEPLTDKTTTGDGCLATGQFGPSGVFMGGTIWYGFTGTGAMATVSSLGSTAQGQHLNTVLGLYEQQNQGSGSHILRICDNDISEQVRSSELRWPTISGRSYAVQLGGLCIDGAECLNVAAGQTRIAVYTPPSNDTRASALTVARGVQQTATNTGALEEAGETVECAVAGGTTRMGKTVWFRFEAPGPGKATFSAADPNLDSVLAVYKGASTTPLGCDDDLQHSGSSRLQVTVTAGEYLVQVGGYGTATAADFGSFIYSVEFEPTTDLDGDGVDGTPGPDCNDSDPAIKPGAAEVPNNDVDENCDLVKAFDRDGDGVLAGPDCDDANAAVKPGARDVPGNSLDEDCAGGPAPFGRVVARIKARYAFGSTFTLFRELSVRGAPQGGRIEARCSGRGCPFRKRARRVTRTRASISIRGWLRGGRLPVGATLEVRVTQPEAIGVVRRFRIRRGAAPRETDLCLRPDRARPYRC